jgi:hypothetical protein
MIKPRVIQHGKEDESYYCRECSFSGVGTSGSLNKAKVHSKKTGHTIDVYYETWREITYYKNGKREYNT